MSNSEERVREEGPEYRSIALRSSAVPLQPRLPASTKHTGKLTRLSIRDLDIKPSHPSSLSSPSPSLSTLSPPAPRWIVRELSDLPVDHPLVRTNVYIQEDNPQLVANRICDTLRTLAISIDSKVLDENENELVAETQNGDKFAIRLFRHDRNTIIVEIQRFAGCYFAFRDAAKTILRAAKNNKGTEQQQESKTQRFTIPTSLPKRSREDYQKCARDGFQIAYTMLRSNKSDAQLLGLESLEKMTNYSCQAKDVVAKSVLGSCECLKQLISLLDTQNNNSNRSSFEKECASSSQSSILRRKVLAVLANSCEAISQAELATVLDVNNVCDLKTKSFLSFLLSSLREANLRPHDAFQAARCLRCLLISNDIRTAMVEMSAMDAVLACSEAVYNSHEALEKESEQLMAQLQQNVPLHC